MLDKPINRRTCGLTLIELMVGLALLGLILSLAVPNLRIFHQNAGISEATNDLVGHINRARQEAVTRNEQVILCRTASIDQINPANSTCDGAAENSWTTGWLVYTTPGTSVQGDYEDIGGELLAVRGAFTGGATITSNDSGNRWLTINPDGSLNETGPVAYAVCDDRAESAGKLIVINMVGRVRVTNTTSAGATDCTPT